MIYGICRIVGWIGTADAFLYYEKSIQVSWHILEKVFKFQGTKKNRFKFHAYREKTFKFWCNFVTVDDSNFLQGEMIENIENKGIGEIYKMQYIFSINSIFHFIYSGSAAESIQIVTAADEEDPCGSDDCQESESE